MITDTRESQNATWSQRWFAALWQRIDAEIDAALREAKDEVFGDLPEQLVEIGAGRGSNFGRYRPGTRVIAYEPNPAMHEGLEAAALEHGVLLDVRVAGVEDMNLPTGSQQAVVSSLTLCSVDDVEAALGEIQRVLAPGGRFHFVEHIAAPHTSGLGRAQRLLRQPWALLADRCDLVARTDVAIDAAGFAEVHRATRDFGPRLDPSRRTTFGYAVR